MTVDSSTGAAVGLNLKIPLYVGGIDGLNVRPSSDVGVEHGFNGCISEVYTSSESCYFNVMA